MSQINDSCRPGAPVVRLHLAFFLVPICRVGDGRFAYSVACLRGASGFVDNAAAASAAAATFGIQRQCCWVVAVVMPQFEDFGNAVGLTCASCCAFSEKAVPYHAMPWHAFSLYAFILSLLRCLYLGIFVSVHSVLSMPLPGDLCCFDSLNVSRAK